MPEIINCPECGAAIELDKLLAKKVEAGLEKEWRVKIDSAVAKVRSEAEIKIKTLSSSLETAQQNELEFRKKTSELDQRTKELKLEIQRTLDSEREKIAAETARDIEASHRLKDSEKDKKISDALSQVEDLKRRIEQGSQQVQGEVLELELEGMLRANFPLDDIEPVAKGVKGGDILQTVKSRTGEEAGRILYELKRTKAFSEGWLAKIKADARNAKASICILATETMPNGMDVFGIVDGVWITSLKDCIPLSRSLRFGLTQVAKERLMQSGRKDKAELMYDYLIGDEFRARIEALVEAYRGMKEDLESERRAMERIWAKREKQIGQVALNLSGMHGEFQALAGDSLPNVKLLELEA